MAAPWLGGTRNPFLSVGGDPRLQGGPFGGTSQYAHLAPARSSVLNQRQFGSPQAAWMAGNVGLGNPFAPSAQQLAQGKRILSGQAQTLAGQQLGVGAGGLMGQGAISLGGGMGGGGGGGGLGDLSALFGGADGAGGLGGMSGALSQLLNPLIEARKRRLNEQISGAFAGRGLSGPAAEALRAQELGDFESSLLGTIGLPWLTSLLNIGAAEQRQRRGEQAGLVGGLI